MKVFLGGTCNNSSWRDEIIPLLETEFFNPVVVNWTPECQAEELRQRDICDICLYAITPKMTGVYSIAEVVDDSNKRPDKTIFLLMTYYENEEFSDSQKHSLKAVASMVENNGSKVFYSLESAASYINSLT